MAPLLFEDIFNITRIDPDGKKFDKGILLNLQNSSIENHISAIFVRISSDFMLQKESSRLLGVKVIKNLQATSKAYALYPVQLPLIFETMEM